jgi:hypothetical protein
MEYGSKEINEDDVLILIEGFSKYRQLSTKTVDSFGSDI